MSEYKIATLPPLPRVALRDLGRRAAGAFARLAPGHDPHGELRYLWTDHMSDDFRAGDALRERCPPVDLISLPNVEVRSDWMPYLDDAVVADPPIKPAYMRQYYETGLIDAFGYPKVNRVRRVRSPAFVVSHFNMRTYGHFLLEVLPKLFLVRELYSMGLRFPVVLPASLQTYIKIAMAACPNVRWLIYDDRRERLHLSTALLPTVLSSGSAHFHDIAIAGFKTAALRLSEARRPTSKRVFLSRVNAPSFRKLKNEAELSAIARGFGFETISPETLPWSEQVAMFVGATHVVGEFSSALHNTLFCPPSAQVVCLNWWAPLQSALAVTAGHGIGYILPKDGVTTAFKPGWTEAQEFEIEPELFRERLASLSY